MQPAGAESIDLPRSKVAAERPCLTEADQAVRVEVARWGLGHRTRRLPETERRKIIEPRQPACARGKKCE